MPYIGQSPGLVNRTKYKFTASSGQTTISGYDDNGLYFSYDPELLLVYLNGVKLVAGLDYTATSTGTVEFNKSLFEDDIVEAIADAHFNVSKIFLDTLPVYLGPLPSDPAQGIEGYFYYDTTLKITKVYNGTGWSPLFQISLGGIIQDDVTVSGLSEAGGSFTLAAGQPFTFMNVFRNGVKLKVVTDYTISSPNITILSAKNGDTISYLGYSATDTTDFYTKVQADSRFISKTQGLVNNAPQTFTEAEKGQLRGNLGADILTGFRNKIINGDFEIAQRSLSQTSHGYGSVDRWNIQHNGSGFTKTAQKGVFTLDGTHPGKPETAKNYLSVVFNSSNDEGGWHVVAQRIEGLRQFSGKRFTLTYWQRGDAGLQMTTSLYQVFGTGGAPSELVSSIGVRKVPVSGTGWKKETYIIEIPSIEGKTLGLNNDDCLQVSFFLSAGSDLNGPSGSLGRQSGAIEIAHVSLVEGDATAEDDPFSPRHIEQELALCQRYYAKTFSWGTTPTNGAGFGGAISASTLSIGEAVATWQFPQLMRTPPSMTFFNPGSGAIGMWRNFADTASAAVNTFGPTSNRGCILVATSGPTTQHIAIHATADAEL